MSEHLHRLQRQLARAAGRRQAVVLTDDLHALLSEHAELLAYLEHVIEDERAEQAYLDAVARDQHPARGRHLRAVGARETPVNDVNECRRAALEEAVGLVAHADGEMAAASLVLLLSEMYERKL